MKKDKNKQYYFTLKGSIKRIKQEYLYYTKRPWSLEEVGNFWDTVHDYDVINNEIYPYYRRFTNSYELAASNLIDDKPYNVLDIQSIIVHILGNELEGDPLLAADFNADGNVDVLDILAIVNIILSPRDVAVKATSATFIVSENNLSMDADGQVGAIELTLSHNEEFSKIGRAHV